jgi:tRNA 2-thiouridine synthesizing protein A
MTHDSIDDDATEPALLADLDRLAGMACMQCGRALCGHVVLCGIALGCKNSPRCLLCLATGLKRPLGELREQLVDYMQRRDCYRRAWNVASDREGQSRGRMPECLRNISAPEPEQMETNKPEAAAAPGAAVAEWDAGEIGCGDLVMELRMRLNGLPPGGVIKVIARDPAAPVDLPSWCRLTGNRLVQANHPEYFIQRKEN